MARRIPYQRAAGALNKARAGDALTRSDQLALDNLQSRLGLSRPLTSYAPRTQRRYLKAAREGVSASDINRREYRARGDVATGTTRLALIEQYRRRIDSSTLERTDAHTPEAITDLINLYGEAFVLDILAAQVSSIEQYSAGNKGAGNRRWEARADLLARHRSALELDEALDPYFWYHARMS